MIDLNDIAKELFILNKSTVDRLFSHDKPSDLVALYCFYYKTAKWQKTNSVKANDLYVKKSLGWGLDKVRNTKKSLKELGLINIIQRRNKGKVSGWFVEVCYLVSESKTKIKVEQHNPVQDNLNSTSGFQDTDALKQKIKMLEDKIHMLEEKNNKKCSSKRFEEFWDTYQDKRGKDGALRVWKSKSLDDIADEVIEGAKRYVQSRGTNKKYWKQAQGWLNDGRWKDEVEQNKGIMQWSV